MTLSSASLHGLRGRTVAYPLPMYATSIAVRLPNDVGRFLVVVNAQGGSICAIEEVAPGRED